MKKCLLLTFFYDTPLSLRQISAMIRSRYSTYYLRIYDRDFSKNNSVEKNKCMNFIFDFDYVLVSGISYYKDVIFELIDDIKKKKKR